MRLGMCTFLAGSLIWISSSACWASDTLRLGGPAALAAIDGGTDNQLVYHRHGGHHGHHHYGRSYYSSSYYRPYYYGSYYRPYYASYYRPYYYSSYYQPYYYSSYYQPYYYSSYAQPYSYPTSTYYYRPSPVYYSSYNPCGGTAAPAVTLQTDPPPSSLLPSPRSYVTPMPSIISTPDGNSTYPYDGGPRSPIPMPLPGDDSPTPMKGGPRGIIPLEGKLVSLPVQATGGVSSVNTSNSSRWSLVSTTIVPSPLKSAPLPRINYPAYGEDPLPPAPRKIGNR